MLPPSRKASPPNIFCSFRLGSSPTRSRMRPASSSSYAIVAIVAGWPCDATPRTRMFHEFTQMVADASGWAYAILFLFAFLDVLVPIVPSETAVITAGVVAASGDLSLALIIPAAAVGAFLGDNTVYLLGRRFGGRATERFFRGEKA